MADRELVATACQRGRQCFVHSRFGKILLPSQYPSPTPCCLESRAWPKIPGKILSPRGLHVNYGASSTCLRLFFPVSLFRRVAYGVSVSLHPPAQALRPLFGNLAGFGHRFSQRAKVVVELARVLAAIVLQFHVQVEQKRHLLVQMPAQGCQVPIGAIVALHGAAEGQPIVGVITALPILRQPLPHFHSAVAALLYFPVEAAALLGRRFVLLGQSGCFLCRLAHGVGWTQAPRRLSGRLRRLRGRRIGTRRRVRRSIV